MRGRFLLAIAACAALGFPAAAEGAYPGGNGNIAVVDTFRVNTGESASDLRLLGSKGKVLKPALQRCAYPDRDSPITPDARNCPLSQDFSRDGRKLAFAIDTSTRDTAGTYRLVVANADGSGRVTLPALTQEDSEPAWTRGGKLLFTGKRNGKHNLFIVKSDGTGLRQITHNGGRAGAYSSRGLVAYMAKGYVRLLRPGKRSRRLARGGNPDFSPSGRTVLYQRDRDATAGTVGDLFRKSIKRGAKRRLLVKNGNDPVFSPSGKRVLYTKIGSNYDALYTATPRGKRRKRIFRSSLVGQTAGVSELTDPAWQPRP